LFLKLHTIIDDQIDRLLRQRGVPLPPVETRPRRTSWTCRSTTAAPMMGLSFERQDAALFAYGTSFAFYYSFPLQ
jgi:hypothetical protein